MIIRVTFLLSIMCFLVSTKTIDDKIWKVNKLLKSKVIKKHDKGKVTIIMEGDMRITKKQKDLIHGSGTSTKRNAISSEQYKWPNGIIPYTFASTFNEQERSLVEGAMAEWENQTCIRFQEGCTNVPPCLQIVKDQGCWSYVGKQETFQEVSLDQGCLDYQLVLHELGHAIGFYHEHNRPDRDQYITVHPENAVFGMEVFEKLLPVDVSDYGVGYDYLSIMHYGSHAFSMFGERTITTNGSGNDDIIGTVPHLSVSDVNMANAMYCQP